MINKHSIKLVFFVALLASILISTLSFADANPNKKIHAVITPQLFDVAKKNLNWKVALVTGRHAQIVLMNVSPTTNPKNEIGMETHAFDQVIFVVEGRAKSVLDGKASVVQSGDMIFIPRGVAHNFINLNKDKPFKIISIYSATDIPPNSIYEKK